MDRQQGETEGEVGTGEDGESLDEDVCDSLVTGEVGVELVAKALRSVMANKEIAHAKIDEFVEKCEEKSNKEPENYKSFVYFEPNALPNVQTNTI